MHIGLWSPAWPPERHHNGIVTYVHWMKQGFEELGHRVTIFTRRTDSAPSPPGVHSVQPSRWRRLWHRLAGHDDGRRVLDFADAIAPAVARAHRRDALDILEMEESFGWFARIQRSTGVPVIVKLHGPAFLSQVGEELGTPFGRRKIEWEGDALRQAQLILSPSRDTLEQTLTRYRLSPAMQRCIVNPLALAPSTPLWQLEGCDRNAILFVGRFDERKGADVMLQAFAALRRERANLKLIFVGPDWGLPSSSAGYVSFATYRDRLMDPAVAASIDFRGPLPGSEIARLRAASYLTVIASRWENQSYALLEAMLQGCPVVCSDAGGCPESITHDVTGRLASSGDSGAFSREIAAVLDDPGAAQRMGQAARRHVQERHAPRRIAEEALLLYRQALSPSRLGAPRLCQTG